jgi:hypothetical protein
MASVNDKLKLLKEKNAHVNLGGRLVYAGYAMAFGGLFIITLATRRRS